MTLTVGFEREEDQRWIAFVESIPGCHVYGTTRQEALRKVEALALHAIAERLEEGQVNVIFAYHDNEELGPKILARISKETGLRPEDL